MKFSDVCEYYLSCKAKMLNDFQNRKIIYTLGRYDALSKKITLHDDAGGYVGFCDPDKLIPFLRHLDELSEDKRIEMEGYATIMFQKMKKSKSDLKEHLKTVWLLKNHYDLFGLIESGLAVKTK